MALGHWKRIRKKTQKRREKMRTKFRIGDLLTTGLPGKRVEGVVSSEG